MNAKTASINNLGTAKTAVAEQSPSYLDQVLQSDYFNYIRKVGLAVIAFFVLFMLAKRIAGVASKKFYENANITDLNKQESMGQLVYDVVFYILLIIAIFVAFEIVGFDVGVILGGISFGVGFAFKEILGNMIAGVMMLSIKELKLGDIIQVDGHPGYFGKIEEITIRYTVIRTLDLRQVVIPNMELISNPIKTYSSEELVKLHTMIPVSYDTDLDQAMSIMIESTNSLDIVRQKTSTKAFIMQYGDAGVEIKIFFWVDPNCGLPQEYIIGDVNQAIIAGLRKEGIKMPYKHIVTTMDENDQDVLANIKFLKDYKPPATT
ncbi:MAG: mechanosensitive ion channel family protein [Candidatus Absconditabacterales bacterium]